MGSSHSAVPDASPVAEVGQEWRQKANEHAQRRNQYYQESQEAYQRKEGARAKELSLLGKEEERKMHEANQSAVQVIFESNNRTRPPNEIDLHGLFVKEAVEVMRKKLEESKRNGVKSLVVIVGRGNHSQNGIQKLKPAIILLLCP
eukprot:GILI01012128.1.p1 GENE.GILI01012128.1~~GILI01012128.1.p1  ORF type:complete len:146 (+),score=24.90 GILI01012128.1:291-728(+)